MDPRFPIGPFVRPERCTAGQVEDAIRVLEEAPDRLEDAVEGLSEQELETPYRPGGWTVRQVVHHLADSHLNAYVRCRLALTEEHPTIRPYDQQRWAELADARHAPIGPSLELLQGLHRRWVALLRTLDETQLARGLYHPESGAMRLDQVLALYAWHSRHHVAHITRLRESS